MNLKTILVNLESQANKNKNKIVLKREKLSKYKNW